MEPRTVGIVCYETDRRYIGTEVNPSNAEYANQRIHDFVYHLGMKYHYIGELSSGISRS